jgi:hypothetical protein
VAVVLAVFGLSFFGTFTAYVASFFLQQGQLKEETEIHQLLHEVKLLTGQMEELKTSLHHSAAGDAAKGDVSAPGTRHREHKP